ASIHALRTRHEDRARWRDRLWIICAGSTSVVFFILLSLLKPVVPSWPFVSFVVLIVLMAEMAAIELPRYAALVSAWRRLRYYPEAQQRRKPDTPFHRLWWTFVVYGIAGCLLLSFPMVLA